MNETIGNRIAKLRKEKMMSQEKMAEQLGVSSQAVSKWENDISCPDISLLIPLAKLLGVTVDDLLTGNSNEVKLLPTDKRKDLEDLTLRVKMLSSDGDKIRVNLPMMLVKIALEMGVEIIPNYTDGMDAIKKLDLSKIMELAERGMIGKIVEMESANGDTMEVVIE
ncbi:MAG: helix-turn-helix transcriptional regulator [Oscillospiraceae bacterium]|nr:helix-turn-helix transcriptional regulator [Oscillospiraceae bacterium]